MNIESKIIYAPNEPVFTRGSLIFLGGTIDNGTSVDWQDTVANRLIAAKAKVLILNPRRTDWDSTWEQTIDNPQFFQQVTWELTWIDRCDILLFRFEGKSLSPITLLELGYLCGKIGPSKNFSQRVYVSCAPDFWRRGNVEIMCDRHNIPLQSDLNQTVDYIISENLGGQIIQQ